MAIWLTENSRVIVQGMTGSEGTKHTTRMLASGTNIVGGVNPRKAGEKVDFDGALIPVFGSVSDAIDDTVDYAAARAESTDSPAWPSPAAATPSSMSW